MPAPPDAKLHLLTLTDAIGLGGAERVSVELTLRADPARFERSLCVTRPPFDTTHDAALVNYRRLSDAGVGVITLNRRNRFHLRSWWRLVDHLRSQRVDVIHAHKFGSNVWAALLGRALGIPVVIAHEHTWSFEGEPVRRFFDRWIVGKFCDAIIAVSEADRSRMISLVKMPSSRIVVIPNGISWPSDADPHAIRNELGIDPLAPVLAMTAVLRPQKAIDVMLSAMTILRKSHPAIQLLIAGPGDPRDLREMAERLGVADVVSFMGPRGDVANILAGANVGVLSSDYEGFPLAVLEYMAAGLPVVSTDVGGLGQIVENGRTGLLVPRRDPDALAQGVSRVLDDPALARAMGERGRLRQQQEFSSEAMARRVAKLYERVLTSKGAWSPDAARAVEVRTSGDHVLDPSANR